MSIFKKITPGQEKIFISILCAVGVPAIAYGMIKKNNPVFIIGMILVIAGYLLIRKRLKGAIQKK